MAEPIACPQCGNTGCEVLSEDEISTGEGTPVIATSYSCVECRWQFIRNEAGRPSHNTNDG